MRYQLLKGEVLALQGDESIESVALNAGAVWLTRTGDTRDYCLEEGSRISVRRGETLIIEALAPATLAIVFRQCRAGLRLTVSFPLPRPA